jgi:hypothetical protein
MAYVASETVRYLHISHATGVRRKSGTQWTRSNINLIFESRSRNNSEVKNIDMVVRCKVLFEKPKSGNPGETYAKAWIRSKGPAGLLEYRLSRWSLSRIPDYEFSRALNWFYIEYGHSVEFAGRWEYLGMNSMFELPFSPSIHHDCNDLQWDLSR